MNFSDPIFPLETVLLFFKIFTNLLYVRSPHLNLSTT